MAASFDACSVSAPSSTRFHLQHREWVFGWKHTCVHTAQDTNHPAAMFLLISSSPLQVSYELWSFLHYYSWTTAHTHTHTHTHTVLIKRSYLWLDYQSEENQDRFRFLLILSWKCLLSPCLLVSSEVLEEVLVAQKDRDQALMSRLLLANEERDEAVLRARQLQQASEYARTHTHTHTHTRRVCLSVEVDLSQRETDEFKLVNDTKCGEVRVRVWWRSHSKITVT